MRIGDLELRAGPHMGRCAIIAEVGPNHCGDYDRAVAIMRAAKDANADAVKLQVYGPDELTQPNDHPAYKLTSGPWGGRALWQLYSDCATPYRWLPKLFRYASDIGITCFASVFSQKGLDVLERLGCPAYKIASAEVTDTGFVGQVSATGKPVIISDGMATMEQINRAVSVIPQDRLVILKCVSEYPALPESYNLRTLNTLQAGKYTVGVSDHTTSHTIPVMAATLGAAMIEKHIMAPDWKIKLPPDVGHSLNPTSFKRMVGAVRDAEAALGGLKLGASTEAGKGWRRRLIAARDLPVGHTLEQHDVVTARCGDGMEPDARYIGRTVKKALQEGDPLTSEVVA